MKKDIWMQLNRLFPFLGLIAIILIFTVVSGDRLWTAKNFLNIIAIMIPLALGGGGMVFVVAQGGTDLSMGSSLALCGTIGGMLSIVCGSWIFIPVTVGMGVLVGLFAGTMVSKFKVSSLMVTLALMIALRAFVNYLTNDTVIFVDSFVLSLNRMEIKFPIFVGVMILFWYLFEYTKVGFYSRCMGENQTVSRFAGVSITKYQILAFILSGAAGGLCAVFTVGNLGGVAPTMGNFFELNVMIALFVGGIPVSGGSGARFYKVIVGALMLAFLQNGLTISMVSAEVIELIEGIILIGVVFFALYAKERYIKRQIEKA